ncbi:MAG: PolC-type DNA polymerase III [Clostridia bacterium]|nr:PolC-type DNA polymerase III [Clostridia bacterium]
MKEELRKIYDSARISEKDLHIQKVVATRGTSEMNIICSRKDGAVSDEQLSDWEKQMNELLEDWSVSYTYLNAEGEKRVVVIPKTKKNDVEAPIPETGILFGKQPIKKNEITAVCSIEDDEPDTVIEGRLVSSELRDDWSNRERKPNCRIQFNITDFTDSIYCSASVNEEWMAVRLNNWLTAADKSEKNLKVKGVCKTKKKTGERVFYADVIELSPRVFRMDPSEEKRVELHLHSRMSTMDGITNLTEAFRTAKRWGHKAIAVTDHGVVQAFPEAAKAAKSTGVKALFGVEGYLIPDTEMQPIEGAVYTVFDIETTGLKSEHNEIIEIGAVRVEEGKVTSRFHSFIDDGLTIPKSITDLTGITEEMIQGAPTTREVLEQFRKYADGTTLVAHNASFDVGFITHHGARFGITFPMPYADTLMLSRYLLHDELPNHKLDTICDWFKVDMGSHHRADDDANSCAMILLEFMRMLKEKDVHTLPVIPDANEAYQHQLTTKEKHRSNHIIILAKTQKGMKNLYRLISYSHLDHLHGKPMIPKSMLSVFRSGLILGSACEAGELFRAILNQEPEEKIEKIARFYDYLEIQPICNNAFLVREGKAADDEGLRNLNRKIVALGEKLNIPVAATGDVHFLEPEDAIYREILLSKLGFEDAEMQAPLYLKTTEEMLQEFSYLGTEKAHEVVIDVPNQIADMCDPLKPFPDGTHAPKIPNAAEELRSMAVNKAHEIYGEPLPDIVQARLDKELKSIIGNDFSSLYLMAQRLVHKSLSDGYLVGSRGSVGSSFVATMAGITEVNSLPAHYVCPKCRYSDFDVDHKVYTVGPDLPNKACPVCGTNLRKDGFDIPFEVFLGFHGDKTPDIDLNFSGEYQPVAHHYVEEMFGKGHAFRAGTISGIAEKKGYECVYSFQETTGRTYGAAERERLCKGCLNVKVTTGQHPGGIVIVPKDNDEFVEIYDYTPVQYPADKVDKNTITTHFDFHAMDDRLVKLDILGHDDPTALRMLEDITGLNPRSIPLDDPETRELFWSTDSLHIDLKDIDCSLGTLGVPEFGTGFVRQVLENTRPKTIEELVRIAGLTHGTDVWLNNAEPLVMSGIAKLNEVLCTRDDIMNYLIAHDMEASMSFKIMERVRKGKGLTDEMEQAMISGKIPEWFISSCKKIKYMFPRGHAVAYTMMSFRVAYYKVHFPREFYSVYYTVRADAFDITKSVGGPDAVLQQIRNLEEGSNQKTDSEKKKDKELQTILELVYEMNLRGIEMLNVDIYKSAATRFLIEGNAIRPPFNSIPGVGNSAAEDIVSKRKEGARYATIEDFAEQTGANTGIISSLEQLGCFEGMPKKKQISLFDF